MLATILTGFLFSEFVGYWLHVLMHSDKIEFLSRNHMLHHLVVYPPNKPQRPDGAYLRSTTGRAQLLGLGLEWLAPAALLLCLILAAGWALGIPAGRQAAFAGAALAWGAAMFWYMHDAMHVKGFWMERHSLLAGWFVSARRRHDIHHMLLDDDGRMRKNFGICFFFFDQIFGSLANKHERFNGEGLKAALHRYRYIFPDDRSAVSSPPPKAMNSKASTRVSR